MPLNKSNAQSAVLTGLDKYRRFQERFDAEWNKPDVDMAIGAIMQSIPQNVKDQLAIMAPEAMKSVERNFGKEGQL